MHKRNCNGMLFLQKTHYIQFITLGKLKTHNDKRKNSDDRRKNNDDEIICFSEIEFLIIFLTVTNKRIWDKIRMKTKIRLLHSEEKHYDLFQHTAAYETYIDDPNGIQFYCVVT